MDKYTFGPLVCKGEMSTVHKINSHPTICVKCVRASAPIIETDILTEYKIHKCIGNQHPHILPLIEFYNHAPHYYFILPYMEGGDLFDYIDAEGCLSENTSILFFQQLVSALLFCHYQGIVHRDVKPENILLSSDHKKVYLADFGLSAFIPYGQDALFTEYCGSPSYSAPEILNMQPYDGTLVDVWSAGVVLYVMLTGWAPCYDEFDDHEYPKWFSVKVIQLLGKMLDKNPEKRWSMADISDFIEQIV